MFGRSNSIPSPGDLGPLERKVMEILWRRGESSVRDVGDCLDRPLAYTTVMTTLDRLFKKGLLDRRKEDRAFFYKQRYSKNEWQSRIADGLFAAMLKGSGAAGGLLISRLVDAVGPQDAALLDELENKIRLKRLELSQAKTAGKP